jgi:hypothetical protein
VLAAANASTTNDKAADLFYSALPNNSASFEKVLFRNTKTRNVDLAKEFSHGSAQIFTALEERHWHEEGYNLCFIGVNPWLPSPSKSS